MELIARTTCECDEMVRFFVTANNSMPMNIGRVVVDCSFVANQDLLAVELRHHFVPFYFPLIHLHRHR